MFCLKSGTRAHQSILQVTVEPRRLCELFCYIGPSSFPRKGRSFVFGSDLVSQLGFYFFSLSLGNSLVRFVEGLIAHPLCNSASLIRFSFPTICTPAARVPMRNP